MPGRRLAGAPYRDVEIKDFIFPDRIGNAASGSSIGEVVIYETAAPTPDWRVSYRQTEPEKQPLNIDLLKRRLEKQRHAKNNTFTARHEPGLQKILHSEALAAARRAKEKRRHEIWHEAMETDSSSSSDAD